MKCPTCGHPLNDKKCPRCGGKLRALVVLVVLLAGCATGSITVTPESCTAEFTTLFKDVDAAHVCGSSVARSGSDTIDKLLDALGK